MLKIILQAFMVILYMIIFSLLHSIPIRKRGAYDTALFIHVCNKLFITFPVHNIVVFSVRSVSNKH